MHAIVIGLVAGVVCYFMVAKVKQRIGYDDALDAFGVHGVGGTLGAILTGVFATREINPIFKDSIGNPLPSGVIEGNWHQLLNQIGGVAIAWGVSIIGTFVLLKLVDMTIGLRVSATDENEGLDVALHGEEGYDTAS
jgi:ammonium transporter, Amt family